MSASRPRPWSIVACPVVGSATVQILANLQRDRPAPIAEGADIEALELVLA